MLAKEFLDHVDRSGEPRDMVVVDERGPGRVIRGVSPQQCRTGHWDAGAEFLSDREAAGQCAVRGALLA